VGKTYDSIDDRLADFIRRQPVFFTATAPAGADGHVNVSPKGLDTFAVLDGRTVAYLDLTGSGVETISHLRENGRITIMFCAFEGPPKIVRLYGTGDVVVPGEPEFEALRSRFAERHRGVRSVIRVRLERIADSCGYAVPQLAFERDRDQLPRWVQSKGGEAGVAAYRAETNRESIDGLPGLPGAAR
jgi:hypothetical protein